MSRRNKHTYWGGYLWRLAIIAIVLGSAFYYGPRFYARFQHLPIEEILISSPLKNKTFSATVQQVQSDNLKAYLLEEHTNPIVSLSFAFQNAGAAHEPYDMLGLTTMLSEMLTAGGADYDAKTFKDLCAEYGIKLEFATTADNFSGTLQFPKEFQAKAIELFRAALYEPQFDEAYLALVKKRQLLALQLQDEQPAQMLANKFKQFVFAGHPYERNVLGTRESIAKIEVADLESYRQQKLAQDNLLVGIAGDVTVAETEQLLKQLFADLPITAKTDKLSPLEIETTGVKQAISRQTAQDVARFATQGTFRNSVDFYPLYIVNYIFGESGLNSRLNKRIREQEGLTYGIYTYLAIKKAAALIEGSFSATPENFERAVAMLRQEWKRLGNEGISDEELAQAKEALIASYNLRFASTAGIADMLLAMQMYDLGIDFLQKRNDYIKEVTLQAANAAAKKYFNTEPDLMYIGVIDTKENE